MDTPSYRSTARFISPEAMVYSITCENRAKVTAASNINVRAVLADKSRNGHTEEIRALLKKYGADRLSAIDPTNYQALLEDVEGLDDAT